MAAPLFLVGMIFISFLVTSFVIFVCGIDPDQRAPNKHRSGGGGAGAILAGGCGGGGGG